MEWIVEDDSHQTEVPDCKLLGAHEHLGRLYVVLVGPPPVDTDQPTRLSRIQLTRPDGEPLPWLGQNGTGNKTGQIIIAVYPTPEEDVSYVDARLDTAGLTARLIRA